MNISVFPSGLILLLGQSEIDKMSLGFKEKSNGDIAIPLIVLASVLVLGVVAFLAFRLYKHYSKRVINKPKRLFSELARAHRLSRRERRLVSKLAAARSLKDPNQLYLDSNLWVLDPTRDHALCKPKYRGILRCARLKLFPTSEDVEAVTA